MWSPTAEPDRVAVYIRWSTDEQGLGTTLDVQRERVELFVRSRGWPFREELVYIDDGYSGATLERPALSRLREAIQQGDATCVVVYRLDRLSRSLLDTVTLVRREWAGKAVLCSATENFDTQSPIGQMIFNLLVSFAEFERNLIRDRTLSGKRKRAEQGRNAGQRYPLGYRKGANGSWALDGVDEETGDLTGAAALVRRIFDAFLRGMSTGAIARQLNQEQVPTPMGRQWRFHYISRILQNPLYAGEYRYGSRNAVAVTQAAPTIVTAEEFQRVQEQLRGRRVKRSPHALYPLSGLARCLRCGEPLAGSRGRGRRYYVCTGRTILHRCDCAYLNAEALESALLRELMNHLPEPDLRWVEERWKEEALTAREQVRRGEAELATLLRRRQRLEDQYLDEQLSGPAYSGLIERLERDLAAATVSLDESRGLLAMFQAPLARQLRCTREANPLQELSPDETRYLIRLMTASLVAYQPPGARGSGEMQVVWRPKQKTAPIAVNTAGAVSPLAPAGQGDQVKTCDRRIPEFV